MSMSMRILCVGLLLLAAARVRGEVAAEGEGINGALSDSESYFDKCEWIECPEGGKAPKCPADSVIWTLDSNEESEGSDDDDFQVQQLPLHTGHRARRDLEYAELRDQCCGQQRCRCKRCPPRPRCVAGQVLIELQAGSEQPGSCCSRYECGEMPQASDACVIYWQSDCIKCNSCSTLCTEECPQSDAASANCLTLDNQLKANGEFWTEGQGCVNCQCVHGQRHCQAVMCKPLDCEHPVKSDDACCPICPDQVELPLPEAGLTTEAAGNTTAIAHVEQESLAAVEKPVDEPLEKPADTTMVPSAVDHAVEMPVEMPLETPELKEELATVEPVLKSSLAPVEQISEKNATNPEKPVDLPVTPQAEHTVEKSVVPAVEQSPAEKPLENAIPSFNPAEKLAVEQSPAKPLENAIEKPSENSAEKPAENATEESSEKTSENPLETLSENPAEKPLENLLENTVVKSSEIPSENPTEEPLEHSSAKLAEHATENPPETLQPVEQQEEKLLEQSLEHLVQSSPASTANPSISTPFEDATETTALAKLEEATEQAESSTEESPEAATERAQPEDSPETAAEDMETDVPSAVPSSTSGPSTDSNLKQHDAIEQTLIGMAETTELFIESSTADSAPASSSSSSTTEHPEFEATSPPAALTPESTSWHRDENVKDTDYRFANAGNNATAAPSSMLDILTIFGVVVVVLPILAFFLLFIQKKKREKAKKKLYFSVPHSDSNLSENTDASDVVLCIDHPFEHSSATKQLKETVE
ncbi:hypothetical protein KR222_005552 [Zaprionus bogoriensis]|nr:hypothetical protein KR222_005552 [Zaprionus bogoriensis]